MSGLAGRLYVHLSGGERQRVHIARALSQLAAAAGRAGETRCFLLDEPTSSLDLAHQSLVLTAIHEQARRGLAVVAVFHDLNLAVALADELVLLERGRVMAAGPASEVIRDDLLSAAYGCQVRINRTPREGRPFVLPPASFTVSALPGPAGAAPDAVHHPQA
jgi:iron complex transport system ATP-binding protein